MRRYDYHESQFSWGKFILCLLISLLIVGLAWLGYLFFASALHPLLAITFGIIDSTLLVLVIFILRRYEFSWKSPGFPVVFLIVIVISLITAVFTGAGPLNTVRDTLLASLKAPVSQTPQPPLQSTPTPPPSIDKTKPQDTTTAANDTGSVTIRTTTGTEKTQREAPSTSAQNPPAATTSTLPPIVDNTEKALYAEVNTIRQKQNSRSLERVAFLDEIAREHSQYMVEHDLSHEGFNDRYSKIFATMKVTSVGENVLFFSVEHFSASEMADLWYQSPRHRENMLSPGFKRTGVGIAIGNGRIYATQIFSD